MTNHNEKLDEILAKHNGEQLQYIEDHKAETRQAVLDWHDKQVEEVLGRLLVEVRRAYDKEGDFLEMVVDTIKAERNKLKEVK